MTDNPIWFCGNCGEEFTGPNIAETKCPKCNDELHRGADGDYKAWCD